MLESSQPQFDASSDPVSDNGSPDESRDADKQPRRFLGIRFKCCRTYGRIYCNDQGTAYSGRCPKCHAKVRVPVGEGGTSSRFFNAG